jgi:hypothetical protein
LFLFVYGLERSALNSIEPALKRFPARIYPIEDRGIPALAHYLKGHSADFRAKSVTFFRPECSFTDLTITSLVMTLDLEFRHFISPFEVFGGGGFKTMYFDSSSAYTRRVSTCKLTGSA